MANVVINGVFEFALGLAGFAALLAPLWSLATTGSFAISAIGLSLSVGAIGAGIAGVAFALGVVGLAIFGIIALIYNIRQVGNAAHQNCH